jgi:hypothetical protein
MTAEHLGVSYTTTLHDSTSLAGATILYELLCVLAENISSKMMAKKQVRKRVGKDAARMNPASDSVCIK